MKKHWILSLLLVSCPLYASADTRFGLEGDAAIPTGVNGFSDTAKTGFMAGAHLLFGATPRWYWGAKANYYSFGGKDQIATNDLGGGVNGKVTSDALTLEGLIRANAIPDGPITPYVQGGIGLSRFHQNASITPLSGSAWADTFTTETREASESSIGFAASASFGIEWKWTEQFITGIEGEWHWLGVSKDKFGSSVIGFPSVGVRTDWKFGQ